MFRCLSYLTLKRSKIEEKFREWLRNSQTYTALLELPQDCPYNQGGLLLWKSHKNYKTYNGNGSVKVLLKQRLDLERIHRGEE